MAEDSPGDDASEEEGSSKGEGSAPSGPPPHAPERRGSGRRRGGRRGSDRRGQPDGGDGDEQKDGDDKGKDDDKDKDEDSKDDAGDDDEDAKKKKPSPLKKPWVRIVLAIVVLLLLIAFVVWLVHYLTRGRYLQSTNDAYVKADNVFVTATVAATVRRIAVADNQPVKAGDLLLELDTRGSAARIDQYAAQAAQSRAEADQYRSEMTEQDATAASDAAQARAADVQRDYYAGEVRRYTPLVAAGAEKDTQLAQLVQQRDAAQQQAVQYRFAELATRRKIATLRTQVAQADARTEQALAQSRQAAVDLENSVLRAPVDGRVGDRRVSVGTYVNVGTQMLTVVPIDAIYVEANFKETQLGLMRIGQPVTIKVDALDGLRIAGEVVSFQPATGAEFSVLPPQNATGNFTKIVQRVPVRVRLDAGPEARKVLVPGLSVVVEVDTIGSKEDKERRKDEQKESKDEDRKKRDDDVRRDRDQRLPGAGR